MIAEVVSKMTGVPLTRLESGEAERLVQMEDELHKKVVSQHEAIKALSRVVRRSRSGLKDPQRPTGVFIFAGPTGVGKTLLAKTLAEFMFGDSDALLQIDMSEYMEKHNISRLVGAPPGYVGFEEGGQLTERIRRRPYAVVLLDEIEKFRCVLTDEKIQTETATFVQEAFLFRKNTKLNYAKKRFPYIRYY